MTTDIQEWEQQLQRDLAEIRRSGEKLAGALGAVRGRGETRGVLVEVDAEGEITNLQIAPGAMRWSSSQLTATLLDCHRTARADAKTKVTSLLSKADSRIHNQFGRLRGESAPGNQRRQPSDEEIQAADDEYFERRNRDGWTNT
ncbi:hypothetical protein [Nocardia iowensis]|uniref:YbaB/EbfC DNA-binding family protein n=1 Tax=Nocardia iowensis TaxID=204891 RepID=A0ABX8RSE5_NOCIO|nr:hypothetical protein [Nocardia iowensis]QXN91917.1 hypothetical protein KV110_01625 [Nocardia iowensis]